MVILTPVPAQPARSQVEGPPLFSSSLPAGYENLSDLAPVEIDAIEKLMAEPGIAQMMRKPSPTALR